MEIIFNSINPVKERSLNHSRTQYWAEDLLSCPYSFDSEHPYYGAKRDFCRFVGKPLHVSTLEQWNKIVSRYGMFFLKTSKLQIASCSADILLYGKLYKEYWCVSDEFLCSIVEEELPSEKSHKVYLAQREAIVHFEFLEVEKHV